MARSKKREETTTPGKSVKVRKVEKKRYRPGTRKKWLISKEQKRKDSAIPFATRKRMIKAVLHERLPDDGLDMHVSRSAVDIIHDVLEHKFVKLLQYAGKLSTKMGYRTLRFKAVEAAIESEIGDL